MTLIMSIRYHQLIMTLLRTLTPTNVRLWPLQDPRRPTTRVGAVHGKDFSPEEILAMLLQVKAQQTKLTDDATLP